MKTLKAPWSELKEETLTAKFNEYTREEVDGENEDVLLEVVGETSHSMMFILVSWTSVHSFVALVYSHQNQTWLQVRRRHGPYGCCTNHPIFPLGSPYHKNCVVACGLINTWYATMQAILLFLSSACSCIYLLQSSSSRSSPTSALYVRHISAMRTI